MEREIWSAETSSCGNSLFRSSKTSSFRNCVAFAEGISLSKVSMYFAGIPWYFGAALSIIVYFLVSEILTLRSLEIRTAVRSCVHIHLCFSVRDIFRLEFSLTESCVFRKKELGENKRSVTDSSLDNQTLQATFSYFYFRKIATRHSFETKHLIRLNRNRENLKFFRKMLNTLIKLISYKIVIIKYQTSIFWKIFSLAQ